MGPLPPLVRTVLRKRFTNTVQLSVLLHTISIVWYGFFPNRHFLIETQNPSNTTPYPLASRIWAQNFVITLYTEQFEISSYSEIIENCDGLLLWRLLLQTWTNKWEMTAVYCVADRHFDHCLSYEARSHMQKVSSLFNKLRHLWYPDYLSSVVFNSRDLRSESIILTSWTQFERRHLRNIVVDYGRKIVPITQRLGLESFIQELKR